MAGPRLHPVLLLAHYASAEVVQQPHCWSGLVEYALASLRHAELVVMHLVQGHVQDGTVDPGFRMKLLTQMAELGVDVCSAAV